LSIFFTSDTHFSHGNVIVYCNRPWVQPGDLGFNQENQRWGFLDSDVKKARAEEMDEEMIQNWNAKVGKNDIVYHAGDVIFSRNPKRIKTVLDRLNGKIHLTPGNHDDELLQVYPERFESIQLIRKVKWQKKRIIICHYPIYSWEGKHYKSIHLFGHCHGTINDSWKEPNSMDIGVDPNGYAPLSFKEVMQKLETFTPYKTKRGI
jgi:calcineurin-like phosphoesterase family protein